MKNFKHQLRAAIRDKFNSWMHSNDFAKYGQTVWINPKDCAHLLDAEYFRTFFKFRLRASSGRVVSQWPEAADLVPLFSHEKIRYCVAHWQNGLSWQAAGAEAYMLGKIEQAGGYDGCHNLADVRRRFDELDAVFERIQTTGRLLTRAELDPDSFREVGGVLMHLGPDGEPVFSGAGCHRFAMALLLNQPFPAQLGVVHVTGLARLKDMLSPAP
jgi:hypothetical protein